MRSAVIGFATVCLIATGVLLTKGGVLIYVDTATTSGTRYVMSVDNKFARRNLSDVGQRFFFGFPSVEGALTLMCVREAHIRVIAEKYVTPGMIVVGRWHGAKC